MKKTAVLLVNLGTPDNCDPASVRTYLRQFLSDQRVIDEPRWKWLPVLHGIVLRLRPKKSAELYQSIWTEEGSPLLLHSINQANKLRKRMENDKLRVELAMTYGNPAIPDKLEDLRDWGMEKLIVLPLYPQYSSTTTAPVWDQVTTELQNWKDIPEFIFIRDFPDEENFISSVAQEVESYLNEEGQPDALVISYHGIPLKYIEAGDDYPERCQLTTKALQRRFPDLEMITCYQSKFGNDPWLEPNTSDVLKDLPGQGKKHVAVIAPAFTADCLETLEELIVENAEYFAEAGGEKYRYLPAVNDDDQFITCLEKLVEKYL